MSAPTFLAAPAQRADVTAPKPPRQRRAAPMPDPRDETATLRALSDAAPAGPWRASQESLTSWARVLPAEAGAPTWPVADRIVERRTAEFIAAAVNHVRAALASPASTDQEGGR